MNHTSQISKASQNTGFIQSFKTHPASVGETYLGHMAFAARFGSRLIGAGLAAFVHALIPALFETTASRLINQMHHEMTQRHRTDT